MSNFPVFTVFDTETSGLDPRKGHRIIEIAGVRIEDGVIMESSAFVKLVNPERSIPWEAAQINKISDEDVANAQTIEQVLPQFLDFTKGSVLVAHNCDFDMGFLMAEKELCWGYVDIPECLCTMQLSKSLYPQEFRHNLDVLSMRLGIEMPETRHRALPDVLMTAKALLKMMNEGDIGTIEQLRKLAGKQRMVA